MLAKTAATGSEAGTSTNQDGEVSKKNKKNPTSAKVGREEATNAREYGSG